MTGSTIAFNVLQKDAERLAKIIGGDVQESDLTGLRQGEAIARIGTEVVRIKTPLPREIRDPSIRERAIAASRRSYCKHVQELNLGGARKSVPQIPVPRTGISDHTGIEEKDFSYDRLL